MGKVTIPQNVVASSSGSVDIIVHGVGAHGAAAHRGIDVEPEPSIKSGIEATVISALTLFAE